MSFAFQNANGQTFSTATLGPAGYTGVGMSMQQQTGLVPSGTMQIEVTLTIGAAYGVADSLSLTLTQLGTSPGTVLNTNLITNGGAEAGPNATPPTFALYVPGWATTSGVSVAPYGGTGWIQTTNPSPADRGVNLFWGGLGGGADMYQDLDVSPASSLIDAGEVTFDVSAWLGALTGGYISPTLTCTFFDWSGNQVAPTAEIGPPAHSGTELIQTSFIGTLPSGTRRVHIDVGFPYNDSLADDVSFILTSPDGPPGPVTAFSPAQGATGVSLTPTLTWTAVSGVTSYDVYFGTSPTPSLAEDTIGTSYSPGTLNPGTTYYWYLVSRNAAGTTASSTWSFTTTVSSYPSFFTGQDSLGSGVYYLQFANSNLFGYYNLAGFPIIYHYDLGFEATIDGGNGAVYMYDFTSAHWWYTSTALFPYLYDFTLNAWIYYFPSTTTPGHYTTNPRYFSNLTTGKIIMM